MKRYGEIITLLEDFEIKFINDVLSNKSFLSYLDEEELDEEYINYLKELFLSFVDSCSKLEDKAFYRNNRFSKTLFESVFVAVCSEYIQEKSLINKKIDSTSFETLKCDERFISYLQSGSSSTESIKGRIKRATELITLSEE